MSRVCVGLSENPKTPETSLAESPFSKTTVATLAGATGEWVGVAVKQGRAGAVQVEQSAVLAIVSVEVLVKLLLAKAQEEFTLRCPDWPVVNDLCQAVVAFITRPRSKCRCRHVLGDETGPPSGPAHGPCVLQFENGVPIMPIHHIGKVLDGFLHPQMVAHLSHTFQNEPSRLKEECSPKYPPKGERAFIFKRTSVPL